MKKSFIVITSIFEPTEAVKKFSANGNYQLIVVGDKKSPKNWLQSNCTYLSVDDQIELGFGLSKILPYNHYCRKMIGYLHAISNGASDIVDTDDDNIPNDSWFFPDRIGKFDALPADLGFVNIYQFFTKEMVWPRGLPLNLIKNDYSSLPIKRELDVKVGVWQGLADEDPDVDAIYRLTSDKPIYFNSREPLVLNKGTICPFNTQNTLIIQELFPLLYLPTYVTFRFTDILRGLVAQPIMWNHNYLLGFTEATVVQKRNPHDYLKDFQSEIPMYTYASQVAEIVAGAISATGSIIENLLEAYIALQKHDIVSEAELRVLEVWIDDLKNLGFS